MTEATSGTRHHRTLLYTGGSKPATPVGITAGPATASLPVGQIAILTAVNILARVHPEVVLSIGDWPLMVPTPKGGDTLLDACRALTAGADPETTITVSDEIPEGVLSVGIGADAGPAFVYAGGSRWTALIGSAPIEITSEPSSLLGAGMAVTLATGALFRAALGWPSRCDRSFSLWTFEETDQPSGPAHCDPVDLGAVWMVGAGAVGSCLAWWLQFVGVLGQWTVIDGDDIDDTNLNRSLGLFVEDAGNNGGQRTDKAAGAALLIPGAHPFKGWWSDWIGSDPMPPDVLIPVANDFGVRANLAAYGHPATIHATTSRNWTAELHRHQVGRDECVACRFPEDAPTFACATGSGGVAPSEKTEDEGGKDAALPFLSGAAGLLLLGGLMQLQDGYWPTHDRNHWRVFFDDSCSSIRSSRRLCLQDCTSCPSIKTRQVTHGETRWRELDPDGAGSS
jgi:hypothetical protein